MKTNLLTSIYCLENKTIVQFNQKKLSIAVTDLDGDSIPDIALTNCDNSDSAKIYISYGKMDGTNLKINSDSKSQGYGICSVVGNKIIYYTINSCKIDLSIYNSHGKLIVNKSQTAMGGGIQNIRWKSDAFPTGIYFAQIKSIDGIFIKKFLYRK